MLNGQLVSTPEATKFFEQASFPTGRKVMFGDKAKFKGTGAYNHITFASEAMEHGLSQLKRLTGDPTRTNRFEKHVAAKSIADKAIATIANSRDKMRSEGNKLIDDATDKIVSTFKMTNDRAIMFNRKLDWIEAQAKTPDGPKAIREAMYSDPDILSALIDTKPYMSSLTSELHAELITKGVAHHMPDAYRDQAVGGEMVGLADKYDTAIHGIEKSFYSKGVVDQASRRIDPDA